MNNSHNFVIRLPDEQLAWQCIEEEQKQGCRARRDSRGGSGTLAPPSKDQNDNGVDDRDYEDNIGAGDVGHGRGDVVLVRDD